MELILIELDVACGFILDEDIHGCECGGTPTCTGCAVYKLDDGAAAEWPCPYMLCE